MSTVTREQFNTAQLRLAKFLEDKYKIKNQSNGLMEFAAAYILGFDNQHQLNSTLDKQGGNESPIDVDLSYYFVMNDTPRDQKDAIIYKTVTESELTRDLIIDCNCAGEFADYEVLNFIEKHFNLAPTSISESLSKELSAFFNQLLNYEIKYYFSKEDYTNRKPRFVLDDFIFKDEAMQHIEQEYRTEGSDFYCIVLQDRSGEDIDVLKPKLLKAMFANKKLSKTAAVI